MAQPAFGYKMKGMAEVIVKVDITLITLIICSFSFLGFIAYMSFKSEEKE